MFALQQFLYPIDFNRISVLNEEKVMPVHWIVAQ